MIPVGAATVRIFRRVASCCLRKLDKFLVMTDQRCWCVPSVTTAAIDARKSLPSTCGISSTHSSIVIAKILPYSLLSHHAGRHVTSLASTERSASYIKQNCEASKRRNRSGKLYVASWPRVQTHSSSAFSVTLSFLGTCLRILYLGIPGIALLIIRIMTPGLLIRSSESVE